MDDKQLSHPMVSQSGALTHDHIKLVSLDQTWACREDDSGLLSPSHGYPIQDRESARYSSVYGGLLPVSELSVARYP
jgi:hypothetical protein